MNVFAYLGQMFSVNTPHGQLYVRQRSEIWSRMENVCAARIQRATAPRAATDLDVYPQDNMQRRGWTEQLDTLDQDVLNICTRQATQFCVYLQDANENFLLIMVLPHTLPTKKHDKIKKASDVIGIIGFQKMFETQQSP